VRHNRFRQLRWTTARTPWVRAVRAWRDLLPDWTPSLDEQVSLETMPHEHRAAIAIVSDGWGPNDPRWDVLMALLEWERRQERTRRQLADEMSRLNQEMETGAEIKEYYAGQPAPMPDGVIRTPTVLGSEEFERLREESEITVETPLPGKLVLVPKDPPKVFTVRTLRSIREEQREESDA